MKINENIVREIASIITGVYGYECCHKMGWKNKEIKPNVDCDCLQIGLALHDTIADYEEEISRLRAERDVAKDNVQSWA